MSKVIEPENLGTALEEALKTLKGKSRAKVNKGVKIALISTWGAIIKETPVDTGRARGNWFITTGQPSDEVTDSRLPESVGLKTESLNIFNKKKWYMTNNLPYIRVLEYGEYPNPPAKGTKIGKDSYEIRTVAGYSKLAPTGMMRKNMAKWAGNLKSAFSAI